ncbi:MAG TPA: hypothetical protein VMH83_12550, partial [Candidatus Acidoferrum sp.]|nr:hypothetical protein [Candidatus Acidoferrum sp.]
MQNIGVLKLGAAALMAVMLVGCQTKDTKGTDKPAATPTPPPAASRPTPTNTGPSAEELRRQAALA